MMGRSRFDPQLHALEASPDGSLIGRLPVLLPIMAPRLQGDCSPDGLIELSVWGSGKLGKVRFTPLSGPYRYGPNRVIGADGGVYTAQSAPALLIRGAKGGAIFPARRGAWWHDTAGVSEGPVRTRDGQRRSVVLGWGAIIAEQRGDDLVLTVGHTLEEAMSALRLSAEEIVAEAAAHVARCDLLPEADPVLRSMVVQGIHAALSSIRADADGRFGGLAAGQAYSTPARTYYRDGYWTLQPLLTLAPEAVRDQIRLLAKGIQPDGEAPSGVILSGPAQSVAWEEFRRHAERYKEEHLRPGDWWSDHFDSPLFFVLALGDYVRATGDRAELQRHWTAVGAILERYFGLAGKDGVLPLKPRHDRDWADNVYREGLVAYDLGLWIGALDVVAEFGPPIDAALAERARAAAVAARSAIDAELWVEAKGYYADFVTPGGFIEDHLMIDSLTLSRYRAVPDDKAVRMLGAVEAMLESRHNGAQPYGDWGVLCSYPPYKRPRDVRAKSAFAFRYHNGSDWPYLDGLYAEERLRHGLGGARYALVRWWEMCLSSGWAGAVEYYSPPFGRGSLLQGWSAMPAAVAVKYGLAALSGEVSRPRVEGVP